MSNTLKSIEIKPCYYLNITFNSTEGLNKFTEFLFQNNIKGFGFEQSKRNTIYASFFTEEEITKIKERFADYLPAEKKVRTKKFAVYHWDTFDNETFLQYEADTLEECEDWAKKHYGERLRENGADRVEIVDDKGEIVKKWNVG